MIRTVCDCTQSLTHTENDYVHIESYLTFTTVPYRIDTDTDPNSVSYVKFMRSLIPQSNYIIAGSAFNYCNYTSHNVICVFTTTSINHQISCTIHGKTLALGIFLLCWLILLHLTWIYNHDLCNIPF